MEVTAAPSSAPCSNKTIRVIVAGGRNFRDRKRFDDHLSSYLSRWPKEIVELVSGKASRGPDDMAIEYAKEHDYPCKEFPANWDAFGKAAGMIRNADMAKYGTHLLAFWDGETHGTANMIDEAGKRGLDTYLVLFDAQSQDDDQFCPAFTCTLIENSKIAKGRAILKEQARHLADALEYSAFPDDYTTLPIERVAPVLKKLKGQLINDAISTPDPQQLMMFIDFVLENKRWITARRLPIYLPLFDTASSQKV